jgi:ATP-binding cassette subfamily F protein 3
MITLDQVTLRRGARVLLEQASVALNPGEKIGLIGRNGAGKSSLFALLTGRLQEEGGDCHLPAHWLRAEVAQDMPDSALSATDYVMSGDVRLEQARAALHRAEQSGDGEAMALAHAAWSDADGHDARPRAQALCLGLGFAVTELDLPVHHFSGGWRMRLQLARALMCPADLLLLDEPTNHLDLDALVWLENWLQKFHGTLIVISHDREFLDTVTHVTLLLDNAQLSRYGGNYSAYEQLRAQQLSQQQAAYEKQQDKIAHLQKFIDRFKAKATKAKQAQSRVKALERMEKLAPVLAQADFSFEFPEPEQCPNPMLALKDASFGYGEKIILHDVRRTLLAGQRIGILGANGQGKSTLVKRWRRYSHCWRVKWSKAKVCASVILPSRNSIFCNLIRPRWSIWYAWQNNAARKRASRTCAIFWVVSASRASACIRQWAHSVAVKKRDWCWPCWSGNALIC